MSKCLLCTNLIESCKAVDKISDGGSLKELIVEYLPFFEIHDLTDEEVIENVCWNCKEHLKNFHKFYQTIYQCCCTKKKNAENIELNLSKNNQIVDLQTEEPTHDKIFDNPVELSSSPTKYHVKLEIERINVDENPILLQTNIDLSTKVNSFKESDMFSKDREEVIEKMNKNLENLKDSSKLYSENIFSSKMSHNSSIPNSNHSIPAKSTTVPHKKKYVRRPDLFPQSTLNSNHFQIKCDICSTNLVSFSQVLEHYKTIHNQTGYVKCCNRIFKNRSLFFYHLDLHNNPDKFNCQYCDKKLTSDGNLKMHVQLFHENSKIEVECDMCGIKIKNKYKLTTHMKQFHIIEGSSYNFGCTKCNKTFKSLARLEKHENSHKNAQIKKFSCDTCGKELKSATNLKEHIKNTHKESIARIQCQLCNHFLKNKESMRKHILRHKQMQLDIKCKICGKSCTTKAALSSHMRIKHLLERNIPCRYCNKKFKQQIDCDEHESIHTGTDKYFCEWCPAKFKFGSNFRAHRKNVHPEEYEKVKPKWLRPN